jgi:hypothetical protein
MCLGGVVLAVSFFLPVRGISNGELQLLSSGIFLLGLGEWKNHKEESWIKPPNAYTGGAAFLSGTVRRPDFVGILFEFVGVCLFLFGVWKIVQTAIHR